MDAVAYIVHPIMLCNSIQRYQNLYLILSTCLLPFKKRNVDVQIPKAHTHTHEETTQQQLQSQLKISFEKEKINGLAFPSSQITHNLS